jgi:transglutaminase-like putative cysteine protease
MKNLHIHSTVHRVCNHLRCAVLKPQITCLFLIATMMTVPAWAADSPSSGPSSSERMGGKRTKVEIETLTRQIRRTGSGRLSMGPSARWLEKSASAEERHASQKTFAHSVNAAAETIERIKGRSRRGLDISGETDELIHWRARIVSADAALRKTFDETAKRCAQMGLPEDILARHTAMVENHEMHFRTLMAHFDQLEGLEGAPATGRSVGDILSAIERLAAFLQTYQTIKAPPLTSYGLPHAVRIVPAPTVEKAEADIPTLSPTKQQSATGKPIFQKSTVPTSGDTESKDATITASAISGLPDTADLDATIDVQITQEIVDLAASLDQSPLEIYQYVHDRIDFEPYLGSRKGSQETLNQGAGNDYDQCSLLIALLRASEIPARYVRGTVEIPVAKALNWLGVDDAATAGSILTTVGMQGVSIVEGSDIVAIRFEHVWVEAFIPYANYRGIPVDGTGRMWVPMDPSIKSYSYQPGMDVLTEMGFDPEAFISDYITTYHEPSPVELMIEEIRDYLAVNHPELTYGDIVRTSAIDPENMAFIPGALPFRILSIDDDFAEIPSDKRYSIRFHLYNGGTTFIDYTADLPAIAGKRVTISYIPSTQADEDVISAYGGMYSTPPYLVHLKPVLKIDGLEAAMSVSSIGMGETHNSDMHFTTPTGETNEMPVVANSIIAGTYQAIGIDSGRIDPQIFMPCGR